MSQNSRTLHYFYSCNCAGVSRRSATGNQGLVQGPYVAARAGFESTILRSKGFDSTNAPLRLTLWHTTILYGAYSPKLFSHPILHPHTIALNDIRLNSYMYTVHVF